MVAATSQCSERAKTDRQKDRQTPGHLLVSSIVTGGPERQTQASMTSPAIPRKVCQFANLNQQTQCRRTLQFSPPQFVREARERKREDKYIIMLTVFDSCSHYCRVYCASSDDNARCIRELAGCVPVCFQPAEKSVFSCRFNSGTKSWGNRS